MAAHFRSGERIERHNLVNLVAEEPDAQADVLVRGIHLHDVTANPKRAAAEFVVVPFVLDLDELAQNLVALHRGAALERDDQAVVGLG